MPELAKPLSKTRVQLDLAAHEIERMNWIMDVCGIESRKDLFNVALTLLEWSATEVAQGKKIASFDDSSRERSILSMPALQTAARLGPRYIATNRAAGLANDYATVEPADVAKKVSYA